MSLIARAADAAKRWHGTQERKFTKEPYWRHCETVANQIAAYGGTESMVAAAWLHDTMEDCGVTYGRLKLEFGVWVAELVDWLSDASHKSDGPREVRKAFDRKRLRDAPREAKLIKLCDLIDNSVSIAEFDRNFATVYIPEKRLILDEAMYSLRDTLLWIHADKIVRRVEQAWLDDYFKSKGAHVGQV